MFSTIINWISVVRSDKNPVFDNNSLKKKKSLYFIQFVPILLTFDRSIDSGSGITLTKFTTRL